MDTWNVTTLSPVAEINTGAQGTSYSSITFSADGNSVAVGGSPSVLETYKSVATGEAITSFNTAAYEGVSSVALSPNGALLADGGLNDYAISGVLELWNLSTGNVSNLNTSANYGVNSVAFSPDSSTLADGGTYSDPSTGSESGVLELWDVATSTVTTLPTSASRGVYSVAYSPDGKTVAVGGSNGSGVVELWDVSSGSLIATLPTAANDDVNSVAFSPSGSTLVVSGESINGNYVAVLEVWDVSSAKRLASLPLAPGTQDLYSVACSPDGSVVFVGTGSNVQAFSLLTYGLLGYYDAPGVRSVAVSPSGADLAYVVNPTITNADNYAVVVASNPFYGSVSVSSVTLNPLTVQGGASSTGTVTLSQAASAAGATVSLSSNSPSASVPASVTVAPGATTATFTITTSGVNGPTTATITASTGAGSPQSAVLSIEAAYVSSLIVSPTSVVGGNDSTGTVTLSGPAGPSGAVVSLSSGNAAASVPSSVTIPAGQTTGTFTITTGPVIGTTLLYVYASLGGVPGQTATLTVTPPGLAGVSFSPPSVAGGNRSTGTVSLTGPAANGEPAISLSSNSSVAKVPASVTIQAGQTSATFSVTTIPVSKQTSTVITATFGTATKAAMLVLTPAALASVSLSPSTVAGGVASSGTVTLTSPAASAVTVKLTSSSKSATVPASVSIGVGKSSVSFTVRTVAVASKTTVTVSAGANGVTQTASLTITPPTLVSMSVKPVSVVGGLSSTGTATFSGPAPAGGMTLNLSSSTGAAAVLHAIKVGGGQKTATFTVKTIAVATNTSATITGTLNGTSQTTMLTIQAPTLKSLTLSPASVIGGKTSTGTVTISSAAPAGGLVVAVSSSASTATVPGIVAIPAGKTSAKFTIKTTAVKSKTTATITATLGSTSKTAALTVTP